jgi:glutamyl-tRNA reductase
MNIVVLGVSSRPSSIDVREELEFGPEYLADALGLLKVTDRVIEPLIPSTCSRIEPDASHFPAADQVLIKMGRLTALETEDDLLRLRIEKKREGGKAANIEFLG